MTEDSLNSKSEIKDDSILDNNQIRIEELFDKLLRRKKIFILVSSIIFISSLFNLVYRRAVNPLYQGSFTLMISDPIIDQNRGATSGTIENLAMNRERSDIPTLIQYLKSTKVLEKVAIKNQISAIYLSNRIQITVPTNKGGISQRFLPKTIKISLNGNNKAEIKRTLNDLSETYLKIAFERKSKNLREGIAFLNKEQPRLIKKSNSIQNKLEEFRLKNKIISPVEEGKVLTSAIERIEDKILSLESENLRLLFIKENLVNGILYTSGVISTNNSDTSSNLGVIGSDQLLLKEILDVKSQLAKAQSTYKKSSSILKSLNAKLNQLEPILLKNQKSAVEAAIIINQSLIKSSQNKLSELNRRFTLLPKKINEYSSILQEKKIIDDNLASLLTAREKLQLELSQGTLPWNVIVDPFVNPRPYKPDIKENLIYTIIAALSFASLITLLIDKLDNVFHNPTEIEKRLKLPILGFVPYFSLKNDSENNKIEAREEITIQDFINKANQEILKNVNFVFQETFRNIYTSIKFSISDKEIKTICFTSTIPQEGKSLCSLFLAMNVSEISKRTLIIDTDLRRPALHKKLNIDNVSGVSNYLVNKESNWRDFVQQHKDFKNLFFITAGKIPPNSVRLLNSQRMKKLVDELRDCKEYDLIIFDCPPVLGLSDSLIISDLVDGIILTVSLNKVDPNLLKETLKKLQSTSKPVIGFIANSVTPPQNFDLNANKYDYYYNYKYQYKYTNYKYMPEETTNRYTTQKLNDTNDLKGNLNKFISLKFKEKINFLYKNFINWLNE